MFPKSPENYIIREKYQKIYLLSPGSLTPPPGSEVFVGNIPSVISDDELIFIFSEAGRVYRFQRMIDDNGNNKPFAFISYHNDEDANKAVLFFHKFSIRKHRKLNVHLSVNNCRLYFGNIPREMTKEDVMLNLLNFIEKIVKVLVLPSRCNTALNRGYAFVDFVSHTLAAFAKRQLELGLFWGGRHITVEWAYREPLVPPFIFLQIKCLIFKNIPIDCSRCVFRKFLSLFVHITTVRRIYKKDSHAFVHFQSWEAAEIAIKTLRSHILRIYDREIRVEWARPPNYRRKKTIPDHFSKFVCPQVQNCQEEQKKERKGEAVRFKCRKRGDLRPIS
ncbi:probable RNA-binding protein 46 [Tribolium castaneum]|uniref:Putative RNA-binding protein 46-like Protein n=1 Tax=Tribolium castaneum TaxID=7070 RepID=D6WBS0_TRICA|nr:PREDICTED: probable RNA-binding protein 46 [Tribolium castaneum]EEZ98741.2 putative RNA-binding protein 46-like Protein [Tribolium castaneum]|eukprot:XP_015840964.1 PREDICTED: probable RNA-binding protein 46 [Tribolium castaneum]